jgi:hypothetical protein
VFLLIEDEAGTVNLIVPPKIYERDRLTVRTEPLVLIDGTLERHAAAGGAINVLVRRIVPLDAADLRTERPAATVKDFSPLDERERRRILEEEPLVAVGGGAAGPADPGPDSVRRGALAAVASTSGQGSATGDQAPNSRQTASAGRHAASAGAHAAPAGVQMASGGGEPTTRRGLADGVSYRPTPPVPPGAGDRGLSLVGERETGGDDPDQGPREDPDRPERKPTDGGVREHGGAEDFRAVAPPIMSFAQGRRR